MGGQSAIRGFTYQTIISVVRSLTEESWQYVSVEPKTQDDKIDILWEMTNNTVKCQQVKSSINNFSKPDIDRWLAAMKKDKPDATLYDLTLVGTIATGTENFIQDKNKDTAIRIEVITFNIDFLESRVRDEVSRFLSSAGYHLPHATIELIASGLLYQFLNFSVLGHKVSRAEFCEHLLRWVKFNYSKDLKIGEPRSAFSLLFYDRNNREFTNSVKSQKISLGLDILLEDSDEKIESDFANALQRRLPARGEMELTKENILKLTIPRDVFSATNADVLSWKKELIIEELRNDFGIVVDESFFNLGELKQSFSMMPFNGGINYIGTDSEKEKMEAIDKLYWDLNKRKELKSFLRFFNEHFSVELILQNNGSSFDEEIIVSLRVPKHVRFFAPENCYIPDSITALDLLIKSRFVRHFFKIPADSLVTEYSYSPFLDLDPNGDLDLMYGMHNGAKRKQLKKDKLYHQLESILDFDRYDDEKDYTVLKFTFKQVNPNVRMGFPCQLCFLADKDFDITYSITTKNSAAVHQGILSCILDSA